MMALILSAALKGTVVLVLGWIATRLLRRSSADLRHRIWLATICAVPLLLIPVRLPEAARVEVPYTFTSEAVPGAAAAAPWNPWAMVWAIGFGVLMLRLLLGVIQLYRITRRAESVNGVLLSSEITTPLTWGSAIVFPAYAREWPGEKLAIALAHERAHMARRDWFTQSLAQVVTAVFWFHPLMWVASAGLRQEAEQAVDDAVLSSGAEAASYAEQLLEVARRLHGSVQVPAVAMVRRPVLTDRVTAILDAGRIRTLSTWRMKAVILAVAACMLLTLAAFQQKLQAQAVPAPAPAPTAPAPVPIPAAPVRTPAAPPAPAPNSAPAPVVTPVASRTPSMIPTPGNAVGAYPIGNGVTAPRAIHKVEPVYPDDARAEKLQGEVWLSVVIDEQGVPSDFVITNGLGGSIDQAAIDAVSQWRFEPGMKGGVPVPVKATIAVNFRLL
jgi:TonB family protein